MTRRTTPETGRSNRRGITAVWLILVAPLLVIVLGLVLNIGFRWLGRAEIRNAAVSGAQAGAQAWGQAKEDKPESRASAIAAAEQFTQANTVTGGARVPDDSSKKKSKTKKKGRVSRSAPRAKRVLLGSVHGSTFVIGEKDPPNRACLVEAFVQVEGPLGWLTGPTRIHASAAAVYDENTGSAKMVHITKIVQR